MPLTQMTPGGRWVQPPGEEGIPVYIPPKQLEAHFKRLMTDGWMPITDPRREEDQAPQLEPTPSATELALQAKVAQLEALVKQLVDQSQHTPSAIVRSQAEIEAAQAQFAAEAAETNDAARAAFDLPAKNTPRIKSGR